MIPRHNLWLSVTFYIANFYLYYTLYKTYIPNMWAIYPTNVNYTAHY